MTGAFLISRCMFDKPMWQNIMQFRLFFYLVGHAVYLPQGVKVGNILVKRGQILRSYRNLQKDLAYKENHTIKTYSLAQLKRAVSYLCSLRACDVFVTELGTLFTIVNYEQYQDFKHYKKKGLGTGLGTDLEQMGNNNNLGNKDNLKDIYVDPLLLTVEPEPKLDIYVEIIDYLNTVCGTKYKRNGKTTRGLIKNRINDGFTLADFMIVIDKKHDGWAGKFKQDGTSMETYWRPETLFGNKFESYLNEPDGGPLFGPTTTIATG